MISPHSSSVVSALLCGLAASCFLPASAGAREVDGKARLLDFAQSYCNSPLLRPPVAGARLLDKRQFRAPARWGQGEATQQGRGMQGRKAIWALPNGDALHLTRLQGPRGGLTFVDMFQGKPNSRPHARAVINQDCRMVGGRQVIYDEQEIPIEIVHLDRNLQPTARKLALNPPPPKGKGRSCTKIGILDNGVNYQLPEIRQKLAFDTKGSMLGLDVWDNDERPFDWGYSSASNNPSQSAFNPNRHGTMVASVVARYGPVDTCIVPVRYPPFQKGDAVSRAIAYFAEHNVRVVSIQSGRAARWPEFREAMKNNPQILFVVAAGNQGQDLNQRPSYPASYNLPNLLVVEGLNEAGRTWRRSNLKRGSNVIAVRATDVAVTRFSGEQRKLSGTSFAAPKVAGFAGRLMKTADADGAGLARLIVNLGERGDGTAVLSESIMLKR